MFFESIVLFVTCLLSFSAVIFSIFSFLKLKKDFFSNLIFVNLSFFLIGLNSYFSKLYGAIKNPLLLLIFGTVLSVMFSYGIMNFSLGLVHVSKNAIVRVWTKIYLLVIVIVYSCIYFFFNQTRLNQFINILGLWIPSVLSVLFFAILFRNIDKETFGKAKITLCIAAVINILFSIIFKMIPFFFICFASLFTIILAYEYFFSESTFNNENELTDEFVSLYGITNREREIINELLKGKTNKELAEKFFVTQKTIEVHLTNIYKKTGVKNRLELFSRIKA